MPTERCLCVRRVDRVLDDARIADFDELSDDVQRALYAAIDDADSNRAKIRATDGREFEQYDVVRFTEYYEVDVA